VTEGGGKTALWPYATLGTKRKKKDEQSSRKTTILFTSVLYG
jgi:hypothetical protein